MTPERLYSLFAVKCPAREAEMHQLYKQPGALVCVVHSSKGEDRRRRQSARSKGIQPLEYHRLAFLGREGGLWWQPIKTI